MGKIKNIILDFGGVILDLDWPKMYSMLDFYKIDRSSVELRRVLLGIETGEIKPDEFYKVVKEVSKSTLTNDDVDKMWCSLLSILPQNRVDFLTELKDMYPLYLLSNTNILHINYLRMREQEKFDQFENSFHKVYYSYEMDARKPHADIFTQLLNKENIKPEETLFVDDSKENIDTAISLGFQTWLFNVETDDITKLLSIDAFK
ncbi:MAG: HAD family phosphatase [Ichthyobacteriaceae bacterium]|nr:HAD family phosphatase [Ichthyobacteriaceae bacterium]